MPPKRGSKFDLMPKKKRVACVAINNSDAEAFENNQQGKKLEHFLLKQKPINSQLEEFNKSRGIEYDEEEEEEEQAGEGGGDGSDDKQALVIVEMPRKPVDVVDASDDEPMTLDKLCAEVFG